MGERVPLMRAAFFENARNLFGERCPDCELLWEEHAEIFGEIKPGSTLFKKLEKAALPLSEIETPEVRDYTKKTSLVFGLEVSTNSVIPFFGREKLEAVWQGGKCKDMAAVCFLYDERTEELEYLCAAVEVLKGSHCYPYSDAETSIAHA